MHEENTLVHYGVLGMKWGVRRYQNTDGSLTTVGKNRYKKSSTESEPKSDSNKKSKKSPEQLVSERQKKEDVRNRGTLTNAELKEKIERLKLEKELRELTKSEISAGQKFIEDVLKDVGKKTMSTVLTGGALYGVKTVAGGKGTYNRKDLAEALFNGGPKKK